MNLDETYRYIAAHQEETLAELRLFCGQPSVSAEGRGLHEMAAIVVAALQRRGFHTELIPMPAGYPVVYAESRDPVPPHAPTLLIYNHYDVQPEGDPALWSAPPYELTIRDGKALARGVADTKGNIVSRLAAIDALRAINGRLPIQIKWIIEGEEEIGSLTLDQFLLEHRERLSADGCLWEFGTFNWDGTPQIMLGMKGMLTVELSVAGPNRDLHSSMAAWVASPTWRLIWALASLKDENENILIDGFYDQMRALSRTDLDLIRMLPDDTADRLDNVGVAEFAMGLSGYHLRVAEVSLPTCNVQGVWSGYQGTGSKTILPSSAHAKLDLRLVPDQDPDEVLTLLRDHLVAKGFPDVVVTQLEGSLFPARTDPEDPFVVLAMQVCAELAHRPPLVYPSSPASGPMYSFTQGLGLPVVALGCGYPGSAAHGPDENIRLDDFEQGTRLIALLMARMAGMDFGGLRRAGAAIEARAKRLAVAEETTGDETASVFLADPADDVETGLAPVDFAALAAEMAALEDPSPPSPAPPKRRRTRRAQP